MATAISSVFKRSDGIWAARYIQNGKRKHIYNLDKDEAIRKRQEVINEINRAESPGADADVFDECTINIEISVNKDKTAVNNTIDSGVNSGCVITADLTSDASVMTVGDWFNEWLDTCVKPHNKSYRCIHTYADPNAKCYKLKADAPELEEAVMDIIRKHAEVVLGSADLTSLKRTPEDARKLAGFESQINEANNRRRVFYEQYLLQEIDMDTFLALKKECTERIDSLSGQIKALKKSQFDGLAKKKTVEIAKNTLSESAVPRELVEALIEKIYVFPDNQIEINWKISHFSAIGSTTYESK